MLRLTSLFLVALLTSCATGASDEQDGVINGRDARSESGDDEDTATSGDDTGTARDTGVEGEDTGAVVDSGSMDEDTGTPPTDTGPSSCSGEEAEPNNTASTARKLAAIDDCDPSGGTVGGVLSSSSDIDVLTYDGTDTFGCAVNPTAKVTGPARVCIKAVCTGGATTEFKSCPKGTKNGTSECCGTEVEIDINCNGTTSEDTKVTMTVRGDGSSLTCAAYSLTYHY